MQAIDRRQPRQIGVEEVEQEQAARAQVAQCIAQRGQSWSAAVVRCMRVLLVQKARQSSFAADSGAHVGLYK
jgi:hypothetical protein